MSVTCSYPQSRQTYNDYLYIFFRTGHRDRHNDERTGMFLPLVHTINLKTGKGLPLVNDYVKFLFKLFEKTN